MGDENRLARSKWMCRNRKAGPVFASLKALNEQRFASS
jgi:hypothetical protein